MCPVVTSLSTTHMWTRRNSSSSLSFTISSANSEILKAGKILLEVKETVSILAARPRVVLEIGSGPLISGLVSASSCADLLIYSDLLPTNLAEISRSLTACSPCPFMDYIARQADSYIASISSGSVSQSSSYELLYLKYS